MNRFLSLMLSMLFVAVSASGALAKEEQVKGYTKKDGTVVKGYTKHVKGKDTKSDTKAETKEITKETKDSKGKDTIEVKGYTKKDGTVVKGYTRKKSSK
ncbi:MAG: hypothetical protein KGS72_04870 [Cyanobacteria bacterium REEB67]|nr:hypothetical protein [Cyanobacteria bacterium REEB67]